MNLHDYNKLQITESQSELNRYYFSKCFPDVEITEGRLLKFYIQNGEAYNFSLTHKLETEVTNEQEKEA